MQAYTLIIFPAFFLPHALLSLSFCHLGRISCALTFPEHCWTQSVPADTPNTYRAIQTPIIGKRWPLRAHKQRLIKRATPRQTHLTAQTYESQRAHQSSYRADLHLSENGDSKINQHA